MKKAKSSIVPAKGKIMKAKPKLSKAKKRQPKLAIHGSFDEALRATILPKK